MKISYHPIYENFILPIYKHMKISHYPIYMKISLPESTWIDHFQASIQKFCIA